MSDWKSDWKSEAAGGISEGASMRSGTVFHTSIDLDYVIHRGGAREMAGLVRFAGAEEPADEVELLTRATLLKARGFKAFPGCANHDSEGWCLGHRPGHDENT